jgi:hypothetical protein
VKEDDEGRCVGGQDGELGSLAVWFRWLLVSSGSLAGTKCLCGEARRLGRPSIHVPAAKSRLELPFQTRSSKHHQPLHLSSPSTAKPSTCSTSSTPTSSLSATGHLRIPQERPNQSRCLPIFGMFCCCPPYSSFPFSLRPVQSISWAELAVDTSIQARCSSCTFADMNITIVPYTRYVPSYSKPMTHFRRLNE